METGFLYVILTACLFFMILINSDFVFALRINEIESNPAGTDSGAEWVELYSEESVNLEGYTLGNGDGGIYNLSGIFTGYLTIIFPGAWLDNSNESVFIKQGSSVVDQAGPFNDTKNNGKTWSFCDSWRFVDGTRNSANNCDGSQQPAQNTQNNSGENSNPGLTFLNNDDTDTESDSLSSSQLPALNTTRPSNAENNIVKPKKITLNAPSIEDEKTIVIKTYRTRMYVIYSFIGFCVLLVVLIALRKL